MSDRPWLEVSDPSLRAERELLKRLNAEQPPAGSVEHGWATLSAEIAGLQAASASTGASLGDAAQGATHSASSVAGVSIAAKVVAGVALAGGVLWGGSHLLTPETSSLGSQDSKRPTRAGLPAAQSALAAQPVAAAPSEVGAAKPQPLVNPRPASSATTLAEEGRLLAKARQLVQSGEGRRALEVLRLSESRYPRSVLFQEREVVTIEALGATGGAGAARERAQRFLKRYPGSPYAGRLQRFAD